MILIWPSLCLMYKYGWSGPAPLMIIRLQSLSAQVSKYKPFAMTNYIHEHRSHRILEQISLCMGCFCSSFRVMCVCLCIYDITGGMGDFFGAKSCLIACNYIVEQTNFPQKPHCVLFHKKKTKNLTIYSTQMQM